MHLCTQKCSPWTFCLHCGVLFCFTRLHSLIFCISKNFVLCNPLTTNWLGLLHAISDKVVWVLQEYWLKDGALGNSAVQGTARWTAYCLFVQPVFKDYPRWRLHKLLKQWAILSLCLEIFALCLIFLLTVLYTKHMESSVFPSVQ